MSVEGRAAEAALDLEAAFLALRGECDGLLERAAVEGWAPERLLDEVDGLFDREPSENY